MSHDFADTVHMDWPQVDALRSIHAMSLFNGDELFVHTQYDNFQFAVTQQIPERQLSTRQAEHDATRALALGRLTRFDESAGPEVAVRGPIAVGQSFKIFAWDKPAPPMPLLTTTEIVALQIIRGPAYQRFLDSHMRRLLSRSGVTVTKWRLRTNVTYADQV